MKRYIKRTGYGDEDKYDFPDNSVKCSEQKKDYGPDENGLYGPFKSAEEMMDYIFSSEDDE